MICVASRQIALAPTSRWMPDLQRTTLAAALIFYDSVPNQLPVARQDQRLSLSWGGSLGDGQMLTAGKRVFAAPGTHNRVGRRDTMT